MKKTNPIAALQSSDARYRLLVEAVEDYAIYMLDGEGHIASWNPGAERFKGYKADEVIGSHFSRFYTDEDRAANLPTRALDTARRQGRFESEGWRVRKDGARFWAHVVIDPIRSPDGSVIGYAKITRDLTERRRAEETLRRSEEQFRLLVQSVTDYAIYMLSPEGKVTSWDVGAQRIKGYTSEDIIGDHFSRFYTPEDRDAGEPGRALATAAREGRFEKEGWRVRKDGTRFFAHVVVDAIRSEQGELIGFAKITRDITERRNAQLALEQAREALMQSQKMEAIGQLTGGIAHDFNNLLMAILGSLELARKRVADDPRVTPLIDNAIEGAQRGASLTQRMLAFARRQDLKPEPVDLAALVMGMAELIRRSLGPTTRVVLDVPDGTPPVEADANQLEMALLNLAVNARDAMTEGGTLTITGRHEAVGESHATALAPGRYVCLSVSDTGEGMDEDTLARATEPFFTTKGVGKGTGLGLSMVHGIAEQSRGRLRLSSRRHQGTTAELWLPVATGSPLGSPNETGAAIDPLGAERRLTVLAVDDDALVLMNTVAMLDDLGHRVLEASSGTTAMEILRRERGIDIVLTDQAMPGMTGLELARLVQAEFPGLPVVLTTGYSELALAGEIAVPKIQKPFRQDDLAAILAAIAQSHAAAAVARLG